MIIDFKDVQHLIPWRIFNEYGQLTGHYVHFDQIVCVAEDGRIKIWLNKEAFDMKDPERLICDYDERVLTGFSKEGDRGMKDKVSKTEEEWREELTPDQFQVCRKKATERPFSGEYYDCKEKGVYQCVCCGNELFSSDTKFDSGTGWPSFTSPLSSESVNTEEDNSLFMRRIEVLCSKCGAHLGHVFEDGPAPTYERYCINSISLKMVEKKEE